MSNWISIHTPPDNAKEVLVVTEDDLYWVASYNRDERRFETAERGAWLPGATHWRSLPELPR